VGAAQFVAPRLGDLAPGYLDEVSEAFLSGMSVACLVACGVAAAGAVFAARFLPARAEAPASVAGGFPEVGLVDVEDRRQEVMVGEQ
jgi:hypothetical protein